MQGSAKPREASDFGLALSAGAMNRNVLSLIWDFYLVRKARARRGLLSDDMAQGSQPWWRRGVCGGSIDRLQ